MNLIWWFLYDQCLVHHHDWAHSCTATNNWTSISDQILVKILNWSIACAAYIQRFKMIYFLSLLTFFYRLKKQVKWNMERIPCSAEVSTRLSSSSPSSLPWRSQRTISLVCVCVVLNIALHFNATLKNIHLAWHSIFICTYTQTSMRYVYIFHVVREPAAKLIIPACTHARSVCASHNAGQFFARTAPADLCKTGLLPG